MYNQSDPHFFPADRPNKPLIEKGSGMDDTSATGLVTFEDFLAINIRVGRITAVEDNVKAKKPAYVLTIDFGPLGLKTSSAQITGNYTKEQLLGKQVVAIVNFPVKLVAGIKSECLVLAALSERGGTVLLQPGMPVEDGSRIA
jgi:tRNA-binding protein